MLEGLIEPYAFGELPSHVCFLSSQNEPYYSSNLGIFSELVNSQPIIVEGPLCE